jgi:hypothetical protein
LDKDEPSFSAYRIDDNEINEDDEDFNQEAIELFKKYFATPML